MRGGSVCYAWPVWVAVMGVRYGLCALMRCGAVADSLAVVCCLLFAVCCCLLFVVVVVLVLRFGSVGVLFYFILFIQSGVFLWEFMG